MANSKMLRKLAIRHVQAAMARRRSGLCHALARGSAVQSRLFAVTAG
jgi:hypothetical protein